jgi:outer membrane protein assembly factor BamA
MKVLSAAQNRPDRRKICRRRVRGSVIFTLLLACAGASACIPKTRAARLYPEVAEHAGKEIAEVRFIDPLPFRKDTLAQLTETRASRCSLLGIPFCIPGTDIGRQTERLSVETAARDAARLALFYRRSGFFGTTVYPSAAAIAANEPDGDVRVDFMISRGDSIRLDSLEILGTEGILRPDSLARKLPLKPGRLFDLGEFDASADTVLNALLARGYAYAQVLREYDADTLNDVANARLNVVHGPIVVIDSIAVLGANNLGRKAALRQLTFHRGDLLKRTALTESQQNLYSLELIQFASVEISPDTLDVMMLDTARATVIVRLSEAPVHLVEASVGYGTVECLRGQTRWVSRSFKGGARRLSVNGSVSKVGIGSPADFGLGGSACTAFEDDPFQSQLDYLVSADLTQPYLFGPRSQASINAHVDRQSEPGVYQRESRGGRLSVNRRLGAGARFGTRDVLTGVIDAERGRTLSTPVIYCLALQVCTPPDLRAAADPRWRNTIGGTYVRDRTDRVVDPTRGTIMRATATWATPALLSDVRFLRTVTEASIYRPVKPGWVAGGFLRIGNLWGETLFGKGDTFLPPEERFYAGGAYSVRGFDRNGLGPQVYFAPDAHYDSAKAMIVYDPKKARRNPVGGTSVIVANAEVRMPSPLFRRTMRLAAFVDAGAVDSLPVWQKLSLRITPGFGVRMQTPVGPVRADIAYNPYAAVAGPLYAANPDDVTQLVRLDENFRPDAGSFFQRLRFHLAVGQAF